MDPSLDDIALFVEVARRKNFSRAAEALDMPVSTLSRRISELERRLGVRLLNRSTRKIELTEAGGVYFERCQHVVAEARIAHEQLLEVAQQPKGRLRISMPVSFSLSFMPVIFRDFCEKYPDIECDIDLSAHAVDLLADAFDLVLRFGLQPDSGVISRRIANMSMGLYASADYLASHGRPAVPTDLLRHQCLRTRGSRASSIWVMKSGNRTEEVTVSGRLSINNMGMLQRLAAQGVGIVPLPIYSPSEADVGEPLQRVLPDWELQPMPLMALFPSRLMPAKVRVFIEFLQERLASLPAREHLVPRELAHGAVAG
ncbi:LysR family transcriptional regulator [Candidimonas humi]|jgi:DNA-binding transcriptional LysR family regulator|uniref:LysR family transcriptional regulator n=1 Tax=Candidimonas humi TaxID=683355 RepID=A0ABV8P2Q8_9BURK|nr:LysR family transcriptional regulator [Candidimonas humi]MBV6305336.1 LysR family transcriptional regulator [Candidimonas humi]